MGIILSLLFFSEILLPSGVRIISDKSNLMAQISVGLEINPGTSFREKANGLFTKRGYNYLYIKNADSLPLLEQFIRLLSKDSLFYIEDVQSSSNLLHLALLDYGGNISPIVNITVGITGAVDENYIAKLFSIIPDSVISNVSNYYTIKPLQGKHIFYGNKDFVANISPAPQDDDFLPFLIFLQIINDRGFKVEFSTETAPSPFIIIASGNDIGLIFKQPHLEEMRKGIREVRKWIKRELNESNHSRMLVITAEMGFNEEKFRNLMNDLPYLTPTTLKEVWKRYLLDGFVSAGREDFCNTLNQLFPEAEVNR